MKIDKNTHNLGSEWCPGSQNWFYLIVEESGKWRVEMEKDYDAPHKSGYSTAINLEHFSKHKVYETPFGGSDGKKALRTWPKSKLGYHY